MLLTPANTQQVRQLLRHATQGEISNPVLGKAAIRAMADSSIQSITNAELVELNRRRKEKANRSAAYYGNARIIKLDMVRERKQKAATKIQEKETREYNKHEKEKERIYPYTDRP